MKLDNIVEDWGGFERLVAKLHETGDVAVERNVILKGRSGAPRQIDVLIRHRQGLYEHLVVVECKYWRQSVKRLHVDALATTVREVGAAKGVLFSSKGFQAGAITQAEGEGIDLFVVRELTREEWGSPGRIVDLYLHIISIGIGDIKPKARFLPPRSSFDAQAGANDLALIFPPRADERTPLLREDGAEFEDSLEDVIVKGVNEAAKLALPQVGLFNGGTAGNYYVGCPLTIRPPKPLIVAHARGRLLLDELSVAAGLKISQSRVTFDRGSKLDFALAVENKDTGNWREELPKNLVGSQNPG